MLRKSRNVIPKAPSYIYFQKKTKIRKQQLCVNCYLFPGGLNSYTGRPTCLLAGFNSVLDRVSLLSFGRLSKTIRGLW